MRVRIRLQGRSLHVPQTGRPGHLIALLGVLLSPASWMAATVGLWHLAAAGGWAPSLTIPWGTLNRWQVWFALAAVLRLVALYANQRARRQASAATAQQR